MTIIIRAFHGSANYKKVYTYQTAQKAQDVLFIYYYVLTLLHPFLRTHIKHTAMRQQLSKAVPPLKTYQITREKLQTLGLRLTTELLLPVDFSTQEATDNWPGTQRQLLQVAEAILDEASTQHGNLRVPRHIGSQMPLGCSVLGRGAEPLVRTQFLEHPPTLNFGANHLKKWIQHPQKPPIPFLSPHNPHCRGGFWGGGSKS